MSNEKNVQKLKVAKKKGHIQEGNPIATAVIYFFCFLSAVICLFPMWYVLCNSLSSAGAVEGMKVIWYPIEFTLHAYKVLMLRAPLWRAYGNTIIYVVGSTLLMLVFCFLAAYPLTVKNMIGRKQITTYFLIPMYFSAGLIPTFLTYRKYGFVDNPLTMFLTHGYSVWYLILVRTYLLSISEALRDSAKIDGASHFRTLFSIFLPLSKPIIAVIAIYTVIGVWNGWSTANIYLRNTDLQPVQLYLRRILIKAESVTDGIGPSEMAAMEQQRMAAISLKYGMIIFTTLPVLCIYPFFQRYFVKGAMVGSVKG